MSVLKIIVAGSRTFNNYFLLENTLDDLYGDYKGYIEIVSGGAAGADKLGEQFVEYNGPHKLHLKIFPAKWAKYGKSAGYMRNKEMANYADECVVFWDGKSRGTKHMIDIAKAKSMPLHIINF